VKRVLLIPVAEWSRRGDPAGDFFVALDGETLLETGWMGLREPSATDWAPLRRSGSAGRLAERCTAALRGEAVDFSSEAIPAAPPFTAACRRAAQRIPAGTVRTYGEIAAEVAHALRSERAGAGAAAARAVGQAMRRNPTPIVVPCHRVVAAGGQLGGFAGRMVDSGGCPELALKRSLLAREAEQAAAKGRAPVGCPVG
jgi:methylated-DNA-[protein]-cysteine S-methyltransferase